MEAAPLELSHEDMCAALEGVLKRVFADFDSLQSLERLSGGASQETYRIELLRANEPQVLAMRRASGGVEGEITAAHPGLAVEAQLMQAAANAGVPEPRVHYVLEPEDGLGAGFIMQWLEGFTLGAQIVKAPELDEIRPHLARRCGEVLARIHGIDLAASGLDEKLQQLTAEDYVRQTWQRYQDFNTPQPMIDYTALWLLDNLPQNVRPALVHNDFRNGNVMINRDGIVAVLDWEVAHIGDPMRD
ncbi:MAG: phosphotransferase family protein, partial [Pseudomonadota bacterium]|nr:phosphotransferase family protein [Pseudomonadota bacterium]